MVAQSKFNSFMEALALKKHNLLTDSFKIALCAAANPPLSTNAILTDLTQIAYTNASSRALTVSAAAQSGGIFKWTIADLTLSASGGAIAAFQYVVLYNDTAANDELCCFWNLGSPVTILDTKSFLFDFDQTNGILQLQ